jgi:hypothetical protein
MCLFLTATISPGTSVPFLKRADKKLRERDYLEAIQSWVKHNIPIVFCENSNTKSELILSALIDSGVEYEYLCFKSLKSHLGKGHGEIEIFEYAFEHSAIIKKSEAVIKVTGRYRLKNFNLLLKHFVSERPLIYASMKYNNSMADSRFFCFQKYFWFEYMKKFSSLIDENNKVIFENVLSKSILKAIIDDQKWTALKSLPLLEGVYGTEDRVYKNLFLIYIPKNVLFKFKNWLTLRFPY